MKKLCLLSVFTAFAVILGYVEALIPFDFGIYGFKIGVANIAVVLTLYLFDVRSAYLVSTLRVLIIGTLFGTIFSVIFSLAGALLSVTLMSVAKRLLKASPLLVSTLGGVGHNVGQVVIAAIILNAREILYLMPILLILGALTGLVIGICSNIIIHRIKGNKIFTLLSNKEEI